jgi:hypothetical protein
MPLMDWFAGSAFDGKTRRVSISQTERDCGEVIDHDALLTTA